VAQVPDFRTSAPAPAHSSHQHSSHAECVSPASQWHYNLRHIAESHWRFEHRKDLKAAYLCLLKIGPADTMEPSTHVHARCRRHESWIWYHILGYVVWDMTMPWYGWLYVWKIYSTHHVIRHYNRRYDIWKLLTWRLCMIYIYMRVIPKIWSSIWHDAIIIIKHNKTIYNIFVFFF
jgi:hypothetical protein